VKASNTTTAAAAIIKLNLYQPAPPIKNNFVGAKFYCIVHCLHATADERASAVGLQRG